MAYKEAGVSPSQAGLTSNKGSSHWISTVRDIFFLIFPGKCCEPMSVSRFRWRVATYAFMQKYGKLKLTLNYPYHPSVSEAYTLFICFQKDKSQGDIAKFIEDKMLPLVGHYNRASEQFYTGHKFLCLAFYTVDWSFDHREGIWCQTIKILCIETIGLSVQTDPLSFVLFFLHSFFMILKLLLSYWICQ